MIGSLVEEVVIQQSILDSEGNQPDYVGLSVEALAKIKAELEADKGMTILYEDICDALTIKYIVLHGLHGIDYHFLKLIKPKGFD